MKLFIDIILLAIVALCAWDGYKKGLVGGVAGLAAIALALVCGTVLSSAYSGEVIPALKPFVQGYIDSQNNRTEFLEAMGYADTDYSLEDILASDPSLRNDYAFECMKKVGIYEKRAEELAEECVEYSEENGVSMTEAVIDVMCETGTYILGLVIAFLMTVIILVALGNLLNFSLRLPNMEAVDEIGGAVLGFIKGFIYCILLCWFLCFLGVIIGKSTLDSTLLARFFMSFDFITDGLL